MLDWLESPQLRQLCHAGLNKSEQRHALAQVICTFKQGRIAGRGSEAQQFRASGLNLVIAAIVHWNSTYLADAVEHLHNRAQPAAPERNYWPTPRRSPGNTSASRETSCGTAPLPPPARDGLSTLPGSATPHEQVHGAFSLRVVYLTTDALPSTGRAEQWSRSHHY